jgi:hypothetical protein
MTPIEAWNLVGERRGPFSLSAEEALEVRTALADQYIDDADSWGYRMPPGAEPFWVQDYGVAVTIWTVSKTPATGLEPESIAALDQMIKDTPGIASAELEDDDGNTYLLGEL